MSAQNPPPKARALRRLVLGAFAFVMLGGPSPGYIGSCSPSSAPDAYMFCRDRRYTECEREARAGRATPEQFMLCYDGVPAYCEMRRTWNDCIPTSAQLAGCLDALRDSSRDATPTPELPECADFCATALVSTGADGI